MDWLRSASELEVASMQSCVEYMDVPDSDRDPVTTLKVLSALSEWLGEPGSQMLAMICLGHLCELLRSSDSYKYLLQRLQSNVTGLLDLVTQIVESTPGVATLDGQINEVFSGLERSPCEIFDPCLPRVICLQLQALRAIHITSYAKGCVIQFLHSLILSGRADGAVESFAEELVDTFAQVVTELPKDSKDHVGIMQAIVSELSMSQTLIKTTVMRLTPDTSIAYRTNSLLLLRLTSFENENDDVRNQITTLLNDKERSVRLQALSIHTRMGIEPFEDELTKHVKKEGKELCSDTGASLEEMLAYLDNVACIMENDRLGQDRLQIVVHSLETIMRSFRLGLPRIHEIWDAIEGISKLGTDCLDLHHSRLASLLRICETPLRAPDPYEHHADILMALWVAARLPSLPIYREEWTIALERIISKPTVHPDVTVAAYVLKALISIRLDEDPTLALDSFFGAVSDTQFDVAKVKSEGLEALHNMNNSALRHYMNGTLASRGQRVARIC